MEKTNKTLNILGIVSAVVGAILVICVKFIVPVCTGMVDLASGKQMPMKCHYTGIVILFIGILLVINGIVGVVTKQNMATAIMSIALAVFVFVVLNGNIGIGICMKPEMACHKTAPIVQVIAMVEIVIGVITAVMAAKKNK